MPLTRADKEQLLAEYEAGPGGRAARLPLGYQGIKVPQVTALREKVRQSGGQYVVVKNTLALRAIDGAALAALKEHFVGPTAVAFSDKDPVALAKALTDFAKDVPALQFKAGLVEGRAIAGRPDQGHRRAAQPGGAASPSCSSCCSRRSRASCGCWRPVPQSFVMVLDQVRQKKEGRTAGRGAVPRTSETAISRFKEFRTFAVRSARREHGYRDRRFHRADRRA